MPQATLAPQLPRGPLSLREANAFFAPFEEGGGGFALFAAPLEPQLREPQLPLGLPLSEENSLQGRKPLLFALVVLALFTSLVPLPVFAKTKLGFGFAVATHGYFSTTPAEVKVELVQAGSFC